MGHGVCNDEGRSSLGHLFRGGGGEAPTPLKPTNSNNNVEPPRVGLLEQVTPTTSEPVEVSTRVPAKPNTTNNYFRVDGRIVATFLCE
ncbi:unnamed protein product [Dovyalis caffra]|uniref:Uncharacterized protein n=1 Tax=Dovyalis caffra TaxID=77055 RepID=A0AAV1QQX1_9ROSI|nr:unnamed protein product [Dovyalis caffra]